MQVSTGARQGMGPLLLAVSSLSDPKPANVAQCLLWVLILQGLPIQGKHAAHEIEWTAHRRPDVMAADVCSNNASGPR